MLQEVSGGAVSVASSAAAVDFPESYKVRLATPVRCACMRTGVTGPPRVPPAHPTVMAVPAGPAHCTGPTSAGGHPGTGSKLTVNV